MTEPLSNQEIRDLCDVVRTWRIEGGRNKAELAHTLSRLLDLYYQQAEQLASTQQRLSEVEAGRLSLLTALSKYGTDAEPITDALAYDLMAEAIVRGTERYIQQTNADPMTAPDLAELTAWLLHDMVSTQKQLAALRDALGKPQQSDNPGKYQCNNCEGKE